MPRASRQCYDCSTLRSRLSNRRRDQLIERPLGAKQGGCASHWLPSAIAAQLTAERLTSERDSSKLFAIRSLNAPPVLRAGAPVNVPMNRGSYPVVVVERYSWRRTTVILRAGERVTATFTRP